MGGPSGRGRRRGGTGVRRTVAGAATPIDDVRGSRGLPATRADRAGPTVGSRGNRPGGVIQVRTRVNGEWREADIQAEASLLTMLRESLGLLGTKNACEQGECGSCSVWLDGELVCACLVPAVQAQRRNVRTIEAIGTGATWPLQDAVGEAGRVQCGFCTPGLVVAMTDLLERNPFPTSRDP